MNILLFAHTMQPIQRVAIVGAGNMGSGIAQKSAQEEFDVQMVDREQQWVDRGQSIIADFLGEAIGRRIFTEQQVAEIKSRITGVVGVEKTAEDTDLVIEAVFEDFDVKTAVFQTLDTACGEKTILASNTSSLSVNELAEATGRPDRFVGLHFFYHPAKNRLVEVIPAASTSQQTIDRVVQYCKMLGKVVIVCGDRPGFVVNRFFVPWLNEACLLLEEGHGTAAQIDAVARKAFRIGLGPFGLMNLTGPPIALHSTDYLAEQLATPRYTGAANLRQLVSANNQWEIDENESYSEEQFEQISRRLYGVVFGVAAQIVDEGVCSIEDVDRGAKVGLRWARGPFELMNKVGVTQSFEMAQEYLQLCQDEAGNSNWQIPEFFAKQANSDDTWDFSYVDTEISDGIATITINRPEAMNALNETVIAQLGSAVDAVNNNDEVHTMVLDGAGKAFIAGADVKFFVDKIRSNSIPDIVDFTSNGHRVLNSIEHSPKTTIALTTGLALGGGLELALCCDYRIGTRRTQFRFPETSIGIYPGLGGSQRPARISGIPLARWAVLGGNFMTAQMAFDIGLLTHLVDLSEVQNITNTCVALGKPEHKYAGKPANEASEVVKFATDFYSDANLATLLSGGCPDGYDSEDKSISRQLKNLKYTAPIALSMASELIDITATTTLAQGLDIELSKLTDIFSTRDALEGLSALIEGRRATYTNS
ncbi:MAG TPA: 3-hydroxyacyl-CoA dehydrogenase/enoyl-CoA hydratase family protein [Candidatus Poseidoniales archaeon]|nr:MAG TPA: 3-hydroxyacyl-CoA dehydrogenase/enoyl-CoA hydratase family protein [Candidatus Poseidoniales archaeon]|tara:strand:- start:2811 stop:4928 length:2118 start_codon:yes stop_codon:yes gene_type:complete